MSGKIRFTAVILVCTRQQQFSVRVCAGTIAVWLVGLHVLSARLTGRHYRDILLYDLPELLEDAPQAARARMRDGALAHSSRVVRDALSNTYHCG
jgi:hypothetical protein